MKAQLVLPFTLLLACSLLLPPALGTVVAHISGKDEAPQSAAEAAPPARTGEVGRRSSRQEPRRLNVADSVRRIEESRQPTPARRNPSQEEAPSETGDDFLALDAPLVSASAGSDSAVDDADDLEQTFELTRPLVGDDGQETADEESGSNEPAGDDESPRESEAVAEGPAADAPTPADVSDRDIAPAPQPAPAAPPKELSPAMVRLRDRVRTCLSYYYQRPTNVNDRSPWGVMHSLISYGVDTELLVGNKRVNAIGWLCYNRPCRGMTLMTVKNNQLVLRGGPGYQGHEGQLLSMLALCRVKVTYPIRVEGRDFTVADLVEFEQRRCRAKSELSFQLIGLAHYLDSDTTWENDQGEQWSIARMIREELAQPVVGAACGGTHRLIGLSMAVKARVKQGKPLDGEWQRAHKFVTAYQKYAFKLQNSDGSFSTKWLERREASPDIGRRLQTTGHILEWLVFSLPEEDLKHPRVVKSVDYLTTVLLSNRGKDWEMGHRGHALRALVLYNERVFGDKPGELRALLARRPGK